MKIVIAGGTGLIGQRLADRATQQGHDVVVLTRRPHAPSGRVTSLAWSGRDAGPWTAAIEAADAVVNLAGASVAGGRWTARRKQLIRDSRIDATRALVDAMSNASRRPRVLVNASGVGYYGSVEEGAVTESSPAGTDFLAVVCRDWELEAQRAVSAGVRVAMLRTGMVLDAAGGALPRLALPFRFFVGGPLGTGRQWVPWIHHDDVTDAILHIITTPGLSGPVNLASPQPVRMAEFCSVLGKVLRRPSWAPVPSFVLRAILGEMSGIILTGQSVVPEKLVASGYRYRHADLGSALRDLMRR
jgi:uncharacterized protein (TIGR01777 family)